MQVYSPSTITEALDLRAKVDPSHFLAGGTTVNHRRWKRPGDRIHLGGLGLADMKCKDGVFHVGAMVTLGALGRDDASAEPGLAFLARACRDLKRITVRNLATLGGTVAANLGYSDVLPALYALDAALLAQGASDEKPARVALGDYLARGFPRPLILQVQIPRPGPEDRFGMARFARSEGDVPTCKAACRLTLDGGACADARVAVGVLGATVHRLPAVEDALKGKAVDVVLARKVAAEAVAGIKVPSDLRGSVDFKRKILAAVIADALAEAAGEGGEAR